ncbi:MAG: hypothetical protein R2747_15890 [Pyrinomonadaceae bacterium]
MKRRKIVPMNPADLEKLSTGRLLARLRQLQRCEESLALSDRDDEGPSDSIEFKDSPEWIAAHCQLKEILDRREHIPKGDELAELRRTKARRRKIT